MEDDYQDDAQFYDDTRFYDGLEDHPGHPYPDLTLPRWLRERRAAAEAEAEPTPRLLTPEEFRRKHGLGGA